MPNTIFAVLLGVLALYAVFAAVRAAGGRPRMGWLLIAAAAVAQVVNLVSGYSLVLAILTTVGILAGLWMIRSPARPAPRL